MSDTATNARTAWRCDQWSQAYADLVDALQRGEDPEVPDGPFVFSPPLQPLEVGVDQDLRRAG